MGEKVKTIARCDECEQIYSVRVHEDGTVRPIGSGGSCQCGGTEFTVLEADGLDLDEADDSAEQGESTT